MREMNMRTPAIPAELTKEWNERGLPPRLLKTIWPSFASTFGRGKDSSPSEESKFKVEVEGKFQLKRTGIDGIRSLGIRVEKSFHETNEMFDFRDELSATDSRLRIRTRVDLGDGKISGLLTIKQPRPPTSDGLKREFELETELDATGIANLRKELDELGYKIVSSYERVRHVLDETIPNVEIVVDRLPDIGRYVEIEGTERNVTHTVQQLGLNMSDAIQDPYDTIHFNWTVAKKLPEVFFIRFPDVERQIILEEEREFLR